jgi:hypothetical protein
MAVYALWLRRTIPLRSERRIFLYHALSAVMLGTLGVGAVIAHPTAHVAAGVIAAVALHGIYSLSFLELWSLAEGSYSLSILEGFAAESGLGVDVTPLERLGTSKRERRLDSLERLGLARDVGDQIVLTDRGRWLANVLGCISAGSARPGRNRTCG